VLVSAIVNSCLHPDVYRKMIYWQGGLFAARRAARSENAPYRPAPVAPTGSRRHSESALDNVAGRK
jgi:hypothetical protein